MLIAKEIHKKYKEKNYPGYVMVNWNKSNPERLQRLAQEFGNITEVHAALQSMNPETLKAIKRTNLTLEQILGIRNALSTEGEQAQLVSELIVGLPNETWESQIEANKTLINNGVEVLNYNLQLIPGTEMDEENYREKYFCKTGRRLLADAYGVYGNEHIFECEEVVTHTRGMTKEEMKSIRFVHMLIMMMWSRKYYYDFIKLIGQWKIHPVDLAVHIMKEISQNNNSDLNKLLHDFNNDLQLEEFESVEDLHTFWSQKKNFERLSSGGYGKLNYQYAYKIIMHHRNSFDDTLRKLILQLAQFAPNENEQDAIYKVDDVLRFCRNSIVEINDLGTFQKSFIDRFDYDVRAWKTNNHEKLLEKQKSNSRACF